MKQPSAFNLNGKTPLMLSESGKRDPCTDCGSKTACETYSDGHRFCHKCRTYFWPPAANIGMTGPAINSQKVRKNGTVGNLPIRGRFKRIWKNAKPVKSDQVDYLIEKQIQGINFQILEDGTLVSRVRSISGEIIGLHTIEHKPGGQVKRSKKYPDGTYPNKFVKKFVRGTKASGGMDFFGQLDDPSEIIIAEGPASAESLYESNGRKSLVVCAYSAGQVPEVVRQLHGKYPTARFVLAVDQDDAGNQAVRDTVIVVPNASMKVASPDFKKPRKGRNDFNDLYCLRGRKAVRKRLRQARNVRSEYAGPLARIHPWNEFKLRKFPPVEDALGLVFQWPGITQIAGFRGDGKTC